MTASQLARMQRLEEFTFDEPGTRLHFATRLARENDWPVTYAERVLNEYKRFCFLALEAGHPVTPSEDVDQAWHLHLVYTRSYWNDFCPNVLERPLHHGPTKGGPAEAVKHDDWYANTKGSYERFFGEPPPADVWPDAATRFDHDTAWTRVNRRDHWIVPKPKWNRLAVPLAFVTMITLIVGCAANDPLNWTGPQFLGLFVGLLAAIVSVNLVVRSALRGGFTPAETSLNAFELAYLQGGRHRLFLTLLTDLVRRGHLKTGNDQILPGTPLPVEAAMLEQQLTEQVTSRGLRKAAAFAKLDTQPLHDSLAERGLTVNRGRASMIVLLNILPLMALLVFGIWKIGLGFERGKPVTFLTILCVVTFFITMATLVKPLLTSAGRRLLADRRRQYQSLSGGAHDFNDLNPEVTLAVALFGAAALELGAFGDLQKILRPLPGSGYVSSSGSSSGCSSSDSGGGGGCGGSGCGGCGGGGD